MNVFEAESTKTDRMETVMGLFQDKILHQAKFIWEEIYLLPFPLHAAL